MWFGPIKQTFHNLLDVRRHVPELGVIDPVSSGIQGEGKVIYAISVDFVVESEEDTEASMCKKYVCRFGKNAIA
jgi:hypothetical protein